MINYRRIVLFTPALLSVIFILFAGCNIVEKIAEAKGYGKEVHAVKSAAGALLPMGLDEEVEIGRAMAARIIASYGGLYQDEELIYYVNLVGRAVAANTKRTDLTPELYHFGILNSEEINAFALPGGYILITKGTLKAIKNEAELAGVLAHEVAHIDEAHLIKAIQSAHGAQFVSDLASMYQKNDNSELNKFLASSSETGLTTLYRSGLSRTNEDAADTCAVKYASATGYNPVAFKEFLARLTALESSDGGALKTLRATHPPMDERVKVVGNYLTQQHLGGGKELTERYQNTCLAEVTRSN